MDKVEAHNKVEDVKVFDAFQPVDTPVQHGKVSFSTPGTRNDSSFNTTPIKIPLSQPNFDNDDVSDVAHLKVFEVVFYCFWLFNSSGTLKL